jgi:hypothetical protein
MKTEITIANPRRCRKFGYGISTTPSGHGTDITPPRGSDYNGTIKQIDQQITDDYRYLSSIQSAYKSTAIFYDGQVIDAIWDSGVVDTKKTGVEKIYPYNDSDEFYEQDVFEDIYGETWFLPTLDRLRDLVEYGEPFKLRLEIDENYLESLSKKLARPNAGRKSETERCPCGQFTAARAEKRGHKCEQG